MKKQSEIRIHLRTALFVGIILNLINQGDNILHFRFEVLNYFKIILTFFVPFAVSIYSATKTKKGFVKNDSKIQN